MTVGIDLTDRSVRAVTVNRLGKVVARSERTPRVGQLAAAVRDAIRASRPAGGDAGPLAAGVATSSPGDSLPEDVASALARESVSAVAIGAGGAAALAEAWCGAARGSKDVVAFLLGEHVVAGALVGGELLCGAHGNAGAIGWLSLNPVERDDYLRHGGLEAEVAAAGIVRRLVWRVKSGDASSVADRVHGEFSQITAEQILSAARAGDGVSISVVRDTIRYVGMAVSNLVTILDPECVVLGGTITGGDTMLEAVRLECRRRLRPEVVERLRLVVSTLGPDAVAIGAARAAQPKRP